MKGGQTRASRHQKTVQSMRLGAGIDAARTGATLEAVRLQGGSILPPAGALPAGTEGVPPAEGRPHDEGITKKTVTTMGSGGGWA